MIVTLIYCYRRPIGRRTGVENFGQGGTVKESTIVDVCYAAGDDDRGQGGAIAESPFANIVNAIGDGD